MLSKDQAQSIIKNICSMTKHYAVVSVSASDEGTTRFANSEINQNVSVSNISVSLTLYDGKKEASGSANVITGDGLNKLVRDTEAMLPFVPEGEFGPFPFSKEPVPETSPALTLREAFGVKERAGFIKEGVSLLEKGSVAAGALALNSNVLAIGDSSGGFRYAETDFLSFNTVVTYDGGAAGAGEACAHSLEGVDIQAEFKKAIVTAKAARNPVSADIGAYTVVLSPLAFGYLLWYVAASHNAKAVADGYSYAIGNMNKKIFGDNITIRDDVFFPGTQPLYFDFEGNPRKAVTLVDKGVVSALLYDNKTAARQGTVSTGHAIGNKGNGGYPFNLIMEGGDSSFEEMIAGVDRGIFINDFHYTNAVNHRQLQITGLTRNGTFLIENGKLGPAITTMRFTQNLTDSLNNITALTKERGRIDGWNSVFMVPAVRVEGFHFTSKQ
jgi:predicted Zn-dependent protease